MTFLCFAEISHFGEGILTKFGSVLKRKIILETRAFLVEQKEGSIRVFPQSEWATLDMKVLKQRATQQ